MAKRLIKVDEVILRKELGRGFEPLDKGFKPFAFTELCHASCSFSRNWVCVELLAIELGSLLISWGVLYGIGPTSPVLSY